MTRVVLTDIEGTTSSIAFVKDVLFPYAAKHLPEFVKNHQDRADVQKQLAAAREELGAVDAQLADVIEAMLSWIQQDRKVTALKALQGLIWKNGYERGDYQAHVYDDAINAMKKWRQAGVSLNVYSSGSIAAQKLFFAYSCAGDLTGLFDHYFDTTTGPKKESRSYTQIAHELGETPSGIVFLSDVLAELDAAAEANMHTIHVVRDGQAHGRHVVVHDFDAISP